MSPPTATLSRSDEATSGPVPFCIQNPDADEHDEGNSQLFLPPPSRAVASGIDSLPESPTEVQEETPKDIRPLIRLLPGQPPQRRFNVLQKWEGIVDEITSDSVWAVIADLTDLSAPLESVELPLAEIPEADHELLAPGSVFYWHIGYEQNPGGQVSRVSEIRMYRSRQWTQRMLDALAERAAHLQRRFGGDAEDQSTTIQ